MCEVAGCWGRKGCTCWRAPGPSPSLPLARSLLIPPTPSSPTCHCSGTALTCWLSSVYFSLVCICMYWFWVSQCNCENFYFFYCYWQSLKPFETLPYWLVLCKKQGEGISVCQMERDKTGVMICCNHAAKPTTVNYCCNNLLPVAKGFNPGFFISQYSAV